MLKTKHSFSLSCTSEALKTDWPGSVQQRSVLLLLPIPSPSCCHCQNHRNCRLPLSRQCWFCTPGHSPCRSRSWSTLCSCADPQRAPGSPVSPWPSAAKSGAWWTARSCSWGRRSPPTSPLHVSEEETERFILISTKTNIEIYQALENADRMHVQWEKDCY